MSEWVKYTGSDEHIAEIKNSDHGYTLRRVSGKDVMFLSVEKRPNLDNVTHYLIWNPHPLADMICQQARTGLPVWMLMTERQYWMMPLGEFEGKTHINGKVMIKTTTPNWNIPNAEYSFTEFKE